MLYWLENALALGALGSLAYAIFGLAMTLYCRRPGTSLWFWPGMWTMGIWSLPVTERGAMYRDRFMRALSATVVCLGLYFLLTGTRTGAGTASLAAVQTGRIRFPFQTTNEEVLPLRQRRAPRPMNGVRRYHSAPRRGTAGMLAAGRLSTGSAATGLSRS